MPERTSEPQRIRPVRDIRTVTQFERLPGFLRQQRIPFTTDRNIERTRVGRTLLDGTAISITLTSANIRSLLLPKDTQNPLSACYREIQSQSREFQMVHENGLADLVLKRFSGNMPALTAVEEFVYKSLDLPDSLTLTLYAKQGKPIFLHCPVADTISDACYEIRGNTKKMVALVKNDDYIIYQSYDKFDGEAYGIFYRLQADRKFVHVEIKLVREEFPIINFNLYEILPQAEHLKTMGSSAINNYHENQYSRRQILSFKLPLQDVSVDAQAVQLGTIQAIARAQEKRDPSGTWIDDGSDTSKPHWLATAVREGEMLALFLTRILLEEVDNKSSIMRVVRSLRFRLGI